MFRIIIWIQEFFGSVFQKIKRIPRWKSVLSKCFSRFVFLQSMDFRSCALVIVNYGYITPPLCWFQWVHLCVGPSGWQLSHCGTM